ncbi:MAG: HAD family hydrolase [Rhodanobacteraceae bacterium]
MSDTVTADLVFLFDVDNTLLDNDRVHDDFGAHIARVFGEHGRDRYWAIYEELREQLGYADYLGAIQKFRLERKDDPHALELAAFLLDYPFSECLYPRALEAVRRLSGFGVTAVLSDGDAVLQPRKIAVSGIADAFEGRALIYVHKETMLDHVERRYPARHYVMIEDKLRVLDAIKRHWRERVTTVFVRQGHYANDPESRDDYPPAQLMLENVGELITLDANDFTIT